MRHRHAFRIGALAGALAMAACSPMPPPSGSIGVDTSALPSATVDAPGPTGAPPDESPQPTIDPALVQGLALTCGDGRVFPGEALLGEGGAENGFDPANLALRDILTGPDGQGMSLPVSGWHRVVRTATAALFVAPAIPQRHSEWLMVALTSDPGGWTFDAGGSCRMRIALPAGIGPASWWLDPAAGPPPADATSVAAFIMEESCASGKTPAGRVLAPVIVYGERSISVRFAVRRRPGGGDCQGNPAFAFRLELSEPIGDRTLLDSGVFPARDASIVPN